MTQAQFRKALARLGSSQAGFAERIGLSPRQVRRLASGDSPVPRSIEILLALLVSGTIALSDL